LKQKYNDRILNHRQYGTFGTKMEEVIRDGIIRHHQSEKCLC